MNLADADALEAGMRGVRSLVLALLALPASADTSRRAETLTLSLASDGAIRVRGRDLGRAREAATRDWLAAALARAHSAESRIVIDGEARAADAGWLIGEATEGSRRTFLVGVRGSGEWIPTSSLDGLYTPPRIRFG